MLKLMMEFVNVLADDGMEFVNRGKALLMLRDVVEAMMICNGIDLDYMPPKSKIDDEMMIRRR